MNLLLITIDYPPEIRSVATMCRELADELARRGHKVTVVTAWPRYNLPAGVKSGQFKEDMQEGRVRVIRVKTLPLHKSNYLVRGLAQITLPFLFLRTLKQSSSPLMGEGRGEGFDAVIVYSPPLSLAKIGAWAKKKYGARLLLNVQDVFPQNAIDLGILRNSWAIKYFERVESQAYHAADVLTTCTEGARQFLITCKKVSPDKVTAVYNWADLQPYEQARPADFRARYGLEGKFIMLFAGILGPSQGLDHVIEVAKRVVDLPKVVFLFVGDGTEKTKLRTMAAEYGLTNVQFEDFISPKEYAALLKEVDVGLMSLKRDCKTPTIPGKFFGFAAARLPVLAFLNLESEGHRVIREAQCGYSLVPNEPQEGAKLVRRMWEERGTLERIGENGLHYVKAHFLKAACINRIERLLTRI